MSIKCVPWLLAAALHSLLLVLFFLAIIVPGLSMMALLWGGASALSYLAGENTYLWDRAKEANQ